MQVDCCVFDIPVNYSVLRLTVKSSHNTAEHLATDNEAIILNSSLFGF